MAFYSKSFLEKGFQKLAICVTINSCSNLNGNSTMNVLLAGNVTHEIKVTRLGKGWGVRCFTNGQLNQEIQVQCSQDIGVASAEMLRFEDKSGNYSDMASASRERFNKDGKMRNYQRPAKTINVKGSTVKI